MSLRGNGGVNVRSSLSFRLRRLEVSTTGSSVAVVSLRGSIFVCSADISASTEDCCAFSDLRPRRFGCSAGTTCSAGAFSVIGSGVDTASGVLLISSVVSFFAAG